MAISARTHFVVSKRSAEVRKRHRTTGRMSERPSATTRSRCSQRNWESQSIHSSRPVTAGAGSALRIATEKAELGSELIGSCKRSGGAAFVGPSLSRLASRSAWFTQRRTESTKTSNSSGRLTRPSVYWPILRRLAGCRAPQGDRQSSGPRALTILH